MLVLSRKSKLTITSYKFIFISKRSKKVLFARGRLTVQEIIDSENYA